MSRLVLTSVATLLVVACNGEAAETDSSTEIATSPIETVSVASAVHESAPAADSSIEMAPIATAVLDNEAATSFDPSTILAELGGDYVNANLSNGARQFRRCQSCHTINEGGRHTVGPNLYGMMNQAAARGERFSYSSALEDAGLVWDTVTLDAWLENPRDLVPGNRMSFVGLRDAEARRDLIGYIAVETSR